MKVGSINNILSLQSTRSVTYILIKAKDFSIASHCKRQRSNLLFLCKWKDCLAPLRSARNDWTMKN